jgi:UDP-GlcNAc:undecaprenyl-phosphate/decaprenyl-phosphate GlcNAc-1-phosphate transferase
MIAVAPVRVPWPNLHPSWIQAAVALPVAVGLGFVVRAVGARVGALDHPDASLKPHERPVSYLGGLAVAGGVAAGIATHGWPLPAGATVALCGAVALGLADDALRVPPVIRLVVQVGLGAALLWWGWSPDTPDGFWIAVPYVVFFVAALNAVNMVDGMDGLAGSLAVISAVGIAAIGMTATHHRPAMLAVCLGAAVGGFLLHNLPPARLFLGDNGAYLVGAALAVTAFQVGGSVAALAGATGCLGVFLLDLVLSILRRLTGRVPMHRGDRSHLYDQLRARGRSVWGTLGMCAGAQVVFAGAGVIAANLPKVGAVVVEGVVWAAAIGALFGFGFVTARTPARAR